MGSGNLIIHFNLNSFDGLKGICEFLDKNETYSCAQGINLRVGQKEDPQSLLFGTAYKSGIAFDSKKIVGDKKKFLNEEHLFKTSEFKFRVFINESISDSDSAILIENNGEKFFNQNDCKIFDKIPYIQKKYGHISIYTCQFSGATWHPHCFIYPKEQEEKITTLKKRQKFASLLKSINEIKCDYFIPSAGPVIFLDPVLEKISLKKNSIFCDHKELFDYVKKRPIIS